MCQICANIKTLFSEHNAEKDAWRNVLSFIPSEVYCFGAHKFFWTIKVMFNHKIFQLLSDIVVTSVLISHLFLYSLILASATRIEY